MADCVGSIPFYNKKLYLRGKFAKGTQGATIEFTNSDIKVACEGDLRSLVNWENPESVTGEGLRFHYLFNCCTVLTSAPDMPFTKWTETSCCEAMFQDCISLTKAPALPATQLAECCYRAMFKGCSSLVEVSQNMLPATQLSTNCYRFMFEGCSSLTKAPDLLAPALADYCYGAMFNGCSKLSYVKMLATQNAMQAVRDMMRNAGRGTEPTTTRTFIWESREAYYRLDYEEMEFYVEWLFLDKNGDPLFPDEED